MPSSYLTRRKAVYHFRMRVPRDLQGVMGTKEFHQSLKTRDERLARSMAQAMLNNSRFAFGTARHHLLLGLDESHVRFTLLSTLKGRPATGPRNTDTALFNPELHADQSGPRLSELVQQFIEDRKAAWAPKTLLQHASALRQFVAIVGDKSIVNVGRKDCRAYRDLLRRLPPNATKRFADMSFQKIAALGEPPMSPKNVNRVLGAVTAFFNWAVREEFLSHNPTRSLSVPLTSRADAQRDVFSQKALQLLFERSPLYRGCESAKHRDDRNQRYRVFLRRGKDSGCRQGLPGIRAPDDEGHAVRCSDDDAVSTGLAVHRHADQHGGGRYRRHVARGQYA